MKIHVIVFCVISPCSDAVEYQHLQGEVMEAAWPSKICVYNVITQFTTRLHGQ